ncbi:MAG: hypothetical protein IMY72_06490 [Bacteroidetes bacterium]|nr:hypothetical protein [Bacteroidota bacterium]
MKQLFKILMLISIFTIISCESGKKHEEVKYEYEEESTELNETLKAKIGDWAKTGAICYGIVVAVDESGLPSFGKPIKAKIVSISENSLKLKALEDVNVGEKTGCSKMGLSKGETWLEEDGDLFLTRDKAEKYLKENGLLE